MQSIPVHLRRYALLPQIGEKEHALRKQLEKGSYFYALDKQKFLPKESIAQVVDNLNLMLMSIYDKKRGGSQLMIIPSFGNKALVPEEMLDENFFPPAKSINQLSSILFGEDSIGNFCGLSKMASINGKYCAVIGSDKVQIDENCSGLIIINSPGARFTNCSNLVVVGEPNKEFTNVQNQQFGELPKNDLANLFIDYDFDIAPGLFETIKLQLDLNVLKEKLDQDGDFEIEVDL